MGSSKLCYQIEIPYLSAPFGNHFLKSMVPSCYKARHITPQTDGQSEVVNRILQSFLRCFVMDHPREWVSYLHLAEIWYNASKHSESGVTAFQLTYGQPLPPLIWDVDSSLDDEVTGLCEGKKREFSISLRKVWKRQMQNRKKLQTRKKKTIVWDWGLRSPPRPRSPLGERFNESMKYWSKPHLYDLICSDLILAS